MIPGNCFMYAVLLWLWHGGSMVRTYRLGTNIPHWVVMCQDGKVRHFTVVKDFLPHPFCLALFLGRFEVVS